MFTGSTVRPYWTIPLTTFQRLAPMQEVVLILFVARPTMTAEWFQSLNLNLNSKSDSKSDFSSSDLAILGWRNDGFNVENRVCVDPRDVIPYDFVSILARAGVEYLLTVTQISVIQNILVKCSRFQGLFCELDSCIRSRLSRTCRVSLWSLKAALHSRFDFTVS